MTVYARWWTPIPEAEIGGGGGNYTVNLPNRPDPGNVNVGTDDDGRTVITITPPDGDYYFPGDVEVIKIPDGYVMDEEPLVDENGNLVVVIMLPRAIFNLNGGEVGGDWRPIVVSVPLGSEIGAHNVPLPRNIGFRLVGWQQNPTLTAAQVGNIVMDQNRITFVAVWEARSNEGGGVIGGGVTGGGGTGGGTGVGGVGVGTGSGEGVGGAGVGYDDGAAPGDQPHVNYNPPTGGIAPGVNDGSTASSDSNNRISFIALSLLMIAAMAFAHKKERGNA